MNECIAAEAIMWDDEWTGATADGKPAAQFEHTVLMTAEGPVRLTGMCFCDP